MEKTTKTDLTTLEVRLQEYNRQIEENEAKMAEATVDTYTAINRRNIELQIKVVAINDSISRITERNFCKKMPDNGIRIPTTNTNRYSK
jgi:predicted  nucleic acid-binding Zn-ribbon protein